MTQTKTPKICKCHGIPRNKYGACVIKKRATDRSVQERRIQSIIAGVIRFSRVYPTVEEANEARYRLLDFRSGQSTQYQEEVKNGW